MRDILAIGVGIVTALLAPLFDKYSLPWWALLIAGFLIIAFAGGHLIVERLRPKRLPNLHCSFDMKDIGGCVCPETILTRTGDAVISNPSAATIGRAAQMEPTSSSAPEMTFVRGGPQGTITVSGGHYGGHFVVQDKVTYYRIKVAAENGTIIGAKGRLISLKRGSERLIAETINLPFAPAEANDLDRLNKTIHVGSPEHLDFLLISDSNRVELTPPDFAFPSAVKPSELFKMPGDYFLTIKVLSPAAEGEIVVVFKWTGKRETSTIAAMN